MTTINIDDAIYNKWKELWSSKPRTIYPTLKHFTERYIIDTLNKEGYKIKE